MTLCTGDRLPPPARCGRKEGQTWRLKYWFTYIKSKTLSSLDLINNLIFQDLLKQNLVVYQRRRNRYPLLFYHERMMLPVLSSKRNEVKIALPVLRQKLWITRFRWLIVLKTTFAFGYPNDWGSATAVNITELEISMHLRKSRTTKVFCFSFSIMETLKMKIYTVRKYLN